MEITDRKQFNAQVSAQLYDGREIMLVSKGKPTIGIRKGMLDNIKFYSYNEDRYRYDYLNRLSLTQSPLDLIYELCVEYHGYTCDDIQYEMH